MVTSKFFSRNEITKRGKYRKYDLYLFIRIGFGPSEHALNLSPSKNLPLFNLSSLEVVVYTLGYCLIVVGKGNHQC